MSNSNSMVAHIWANQAKDNARSSNGNFHFTGPIIYSYRTPVAVIHATCVLIKSEWYSRTTSGKHMPAIRRALRSDKPYFFVPSIGAGSGHNNDSNRIDHAANLKHFQEGFAAAVKRWENARDDHHTKWASEYAAAITDSMTEYAQAFKLAGKAWHAPARDFVDTRDDVLAYRASKDTPEQVAKRARDQARREVKRAEQAQLMLLADAEKLAAWRSGQLIVYRSAVGANAALRLRGEMVQTSQGADFPIAHAKRVWPLLVAIRATKAAWETNGHSIPLGNFKLNRVEVDGTIKAGCHTVAWSEVEAIAEELGLA